MGSGAGGARAGHEDSARSHGRQRFSYAMKYRKLRASFSPASSRCPVDRMRRLFIGLTWLTTTALLQACDGGKNSSSQQAKDPNESAVIRIDGSSTVFPIAEAVSEEFQVQ